MHVRLVALALLALVTLTATVPAAAQEPPRILTGCGELIDCVPMALYLKLEDVYSESLNKIEAHPLVNRVTGYDQQYFKGEVVFVGRWEVEMLVTGRIADGPMKRHTVLLEVGTAEMDCSGLGNLHVPVVGYSKGGNPVILTTAGPFEVVEELFGVGCKGCIEIVDRDTKKTVAEHRTPFWDLMFSRTEPESFSYDNRGALYLRRGVCIRLHNDRRFEPVSDERCAPIQELERANRGIPGMVRDPNTSLYENSQSKYWMVLHAGACT